MVVGSFDGDTWVPWRGGEEEWRPTGLVAAAMMDRLDVQRKQNCFGATFMRRFKLLYVTV